MIHPVILCGGLGSRLWPLSRKTYPKQFVRISGEETLFQASARRLSGAGFAAPLVLTSNPFRFIVMEQLAQVEMAAQDVLIEPDGRNTAPAVLAAALWLRQHHGEEALMLVAPSDHAIADGAAFRAAIDAAVPCARAGGLVTFGVPPTRPDTGYGYLELPPGADLAAAVPQALTRFVEKPDAAGAAAMLAAGHYLWNAGIFLFTAQTIISAYETHAPALFSAVSGAVRGASSDLGFVRLDPDSWAGAETISIDFAIMEKAAGLHVMPLQSDWTDLGSWDAVWQEHSPDSSGNVCSTNANGIDCRNTLLRSESDGLQLVGIGLEDIIAVAMPDAVLVVHKAEAQRVQEAVAVLKAGQIRQAETFPREHRPWGWFETLTQEPQFQVKRVVVDPGAALSSQSHNHRSEHWVVVEGSARVTLRGAEQAVHKNQSIYIPVGAEHRLENPGPMPLVLIEVQTGTQLGGDDIIRYSEGVAAPSILGPHADVD